MLTDMILEEEFEIKEEEPWYHKQDLEHDLHLAAELGKTLLERNRELEQGLQQMYSTNQEQLQEIEYLTKQVDLLRQVNDQHAKMYEQLDVSAREMEQANHKLCQDNRAAQQKTEGLTETVERLQSQVEELQREVDELKTTPAAVLGKPHREMTRWPHGTRSVSCLKELQNTHSCRGYELGEPSELVWREEEHASLRRSLRSLQTQLATERTRRQEAEREASLLANENAALERQLGVMDGCRARLAELEVEAKELRQLWQDKSAAKSPRPTVSHRFLPGRTLPTPREEEELEEEEEELEEEMLEDELEEARWRQGARDHERSCARHSAAVRYGGVSLLHEVDAQYSALQLRYDQLLQHCCRPPVDGHSHQAVQTPTAASPPGADTAGDFHQPEYKALFKEIFSCIQKTKEDLSENRGKSSADVAVPLSQEAFDNPFLPEQ